MSTSVQECPRCLMESRLRVRHFSDQATAALVVWEEINKSLIGEAICDMCYGELRDVLIERNAELESGKLIPPSQRQDIYAKAPTPKTALVQPVAPITAAVERAPSKTDTSAAKASSSAAKSAAKAAPVAQKKASASKKVAAKKTTDTKKKSVKKAG